MNRWFLVRVNVKVQHDPLGIYLVSAIEGPSLEPGYEEAYEADPQHEYDQSQQGKIAEDSFNFTSAEPSQHPIITQVDNVHAFFDTEIHFPDIEDIIEHDDDLSTPSEQRVARMEPEQIQQRKTSITSGEKEGKVPKKRKQNGDVVGMMERYLAMRTKQAEKEAAELSWERVEARNVDDFSIERCISIVNTMEEMSSDEKVKAFGVFKSEQNWEIFLCAALESGLLWVRSEMTKTVTTHGSN